MFYATHARLNKFINETLFWFVFVLLDLNTFLDSLGKENKTILFTKRFYCFFIVFLNKNICFDDLYSQS